MKRRPTVDGHHGTVVTTPMAATMMALLGSGVTAGSVTLSRDEFKAVKKLYGYKREKPNAKPPAPTPPNRDDFGSAWKYEEAVKAHAKALEAHAKWEDPQPLMQAGADRNAIRDAECDGLRLLAWIAKFVPPGEDPLKTLVQAAVDAGWDVDPSDVSWVQGAEEEEDVEV